MAPLGGQTVSSARRDCRGPWPPSDRVGRRPGRPRCRVRRRRRHRHRHRHRHRRCRGSRHPASRRPTVSRRHRNHRPPATHRLRGRRRPRGPRRLGRRRRTCRLLGRRPTSRRPAIPHRRSLLLRKPRCRRRADRRRSRRFRTRPWPGRPPKRRPGPAPPNGWMPGRRRPRWNVVRRRAGTPPPALGGRSQAAAARVRSSHSGPPPPRTASVELQPHRAELLAQPDRPPSPHDQQWCPGHCIALSLPRILPPNRLFRPGARPESRPAPARIARRPAQSLKTNMEVVGDRVRLDDRRLARGRSGGDAEPDLILSRAVFLWRRQ